MTTWAFDLGVHVTAELPPGEARIIKPRVAKRNHGWIVWVRIAPDGRDVAVPLGCTDGYLVFFRLDGLPGEAHILVEPDGYVRRVGCPMTWSWSMVPPAPLGDSVESLELIGDVCRELLE